MKRTWEYGLLVASSTIGMWSNRISRITGENGYAVYRALGGTIDQGKYTVNELLNLLGADGWELVTIHRRTGESNAYHFKRMSLPQTTNESGDN